GSARAAARGGRRADVTSRAASRRRTAWILIALGAAAGCHKPERCAVIGVTLGAGLPERQMEEMGLDGEALRRTALEALRQSGGFAVPEGEPPSSGPRCRATVALLEARLVARPAPEGPPESAVTRMEVALEMQVDPAGGEGFGEAARWGEPIRSGERPEAALRRAVSGAAAKVAAALALGMTESRKPDAEVIRDLDSGDPRLRDYAVRVLADRRNPAAVPRLVLRLKDPDPDVVDRAVGALGQIRDPRAVVPLIELTYRREPPFVAQLARIIGDIGGPEAEAFLATLASGHADPSVRRAAREALDDLRRGRAAEARGPPDAGN
ncbi:MAG TPA: HEAT repeat domain-containing protein, partial [Anaeromyxobacteraceae bacterium]|nr:HEAT repeat domain-containing protein [Anaeromyxobacteraceae bacterium]